MTETIFKPLKYFFLAAVSLLATGLLVQKSSNLNEWFFLIWSTFTGIFLTYRFNDFIDADKNKSLFNALGYQGLPVIIVIKNGKQSFFKNEFVSEEELRKAL